MISVLLKEVLESQCVCCLNVMVNLIQPANSVNGLPAARSHLQVEPTRRGETRTRASGVTRSTQASFSCAILTISVFLYILKC